MTDTQVLLWLTLIEYIKTIKVEVTDITVLLWITLNAL